MNRKQFMQSHGATCDNWTWSWSFVNHRKRMVFFGSWNTTREKRRSVILDTEWEFLRGRRKSGYAQALRHLDLVQNHGYTLWTFNMKYSETTSGTARIRSFDPVLHMRSLGRDKRYWYAYDVPIEQSPREEEVSRRRGQGRGLSAAQRRAVERRAVELAEQHFRKYKPIDVGQRRAWDLEFRRSGVEVRVEVKGTTGTGESVILTCNEVENAKSHAATVLFLVRNIQLNGKGSKLRASGGEKLILDPWKVEASALSASQYEYRVPCTSRRD